MGGLYPRKETQKGLCPREQCPLGTSPVAVAQIRESPDVAQAHSIAHTGQHKLNLVAPVAPFEVLVSFGHLTGDSTILWKEQRRRNQ